MLFPFFVDEQFYNMVLLDELQLIDFGIFRQ